MTLRGRTGAGGGVGRAYCKGGRYSTEIHSCLKSLRGEAKRFSEEKSWFLYLILNQNKLRMCEGTGVKNSDFRQISIKTNALSRSTYRFRSAPSNINTKKKKWGEGG